MWGNNSVSRLADSNTAHATHRSAQRASRHCARCRHAACACATRGPNAPSRFGGFAIVLEDAGRPWSLSGAQWLRCTSSDSDGCLSALHPPSAALAVREGHGETRHGVRTNPARRRLTRWGWHACRGAQWKGGMPHAIFPCATSKNSPTRPQSRPWGQQGDDKATTRQNLSLLQRAANNGNIHVQRIY